MYLSDDESIINIPDEDILSVSKESRRRRFVHCTWVEYLLVVTAKGKEKPIHLYYEKESDRDRVFKKVKTLLDKDG